MMEELFDEKYLREQYDRAMKKALRDEADKAITEACVEAKSEGMAKGKAEGITEGIMKALEMLIMSGMDEQEARKRLNLTEA